MEEAQIRWLEEVLETVREFGAASLELVAWELSLPEAEIAPAWSHAIRTGLLRPVAGPEVDPAETPYALTAKP